jgi:nifR3 family TIM-barrel protein
MIIKNINVKNGLSFPAVAGFSDSGLRMLCKRFGADIACTEMISAHGLLYENDNTEMLLTNYKDEYPKVVQLFGSDPQIIAQAIKLKVLSNFDIIDLNFGCPARKIISTGAGSALMRDGVKVYNIVKAAVKAACGRAVTIKMRSGVSQDCINAVEIARIVEDAGANAITIHGRTADMHYSGTCNLDVIREVKSAVKIPVIGNGDVFDRKSYLHMIKATNVDGVAIARGAIGRPYVFSEIIGLDIKVDIVALIVEHFTEILKYMPEKMAVNHMKKHTVMYIKGIRDSKKLHPLIFKATTADNFKTILKELDSLKE